MGKTSIEWTNKVWNPVTGCTKVSQGCKNCYAERMFKRAYGRQTVSNGIPHGLSENLISIGTRSREFTDIQCHPERLDQPLHWRKPCKIFVNSMSDLFHESVPDEFIDKVFEAICSCRGRHTFQILTKRPARMRDWLLNAREKCSGWFNPRTGILDLWQTWLCVSVEDQATADERIPILLQTPAAVRGISAEPLLGPIDLNLSTQSSALSPKIDWIIVGGESGPGARPMHPDWARSIRDQCSAAGVPFFFKQWGEWAPTECRSGGDLGGDMRLDVVRIVKPFGENDGHFRPGDVLMRRIGKKKSGALLDGREWREFPAA